MLWRWEEHNVDVNTALPIDSNHGRLVSGVTLAHWYTGTLVWLPSYYNGKTDTVVARQAAVQAGAGASTGQTETAELGPG